MATKKKRSSRRSSRSSRGGRPRFGHALSLSPTVHSVSTPRRVPTLWKGGWINVTPRMWAHFMKEAREQKAWANRTAKDPSWAAGASVMSNEMLADALKKTVEEMATDSLRYTHYRASLGHGYKGESASDPSARRQWLALGGTLSNRSANVPRLTNMLKAASRRLS